MLKIISNKNSVVNCVKNIFSSWIRYILTARRFIPAFAIAIHVMFYVMIVKFENYNWYGAIAYSKALFTRSKMGYFFDLDKIIETYDVDDKIQYLNYLDILNNTYYIQSFQNITNFLSFLILLVLMITFILLNLFFLINWLIKFNK